MPDLPHHWRSSWKSSGEIAKSLSKIFCPRERRIQVSMKFMLNKLHLTYPTLIKQKTYFNASTATKRGEKPTRDNANCLRLLPFELPQSLPPFPTELTPTTHLSLGK